MIQKDQVFIVDMMVTNPTQKTMALSVISQIASAVEHAQFASLRFASIEGFMKGTILFQWH
jgi:hypothetical protein